MLGKFFQETRHIIASLILPIIAYDRYNQLEFLLIILMIAWRVACLHQNIGENAYGPTLKLFCQPDSVFIVLGKY